MTNAQESPLALAKTLLAQPEVMALLRDIQSLRDSIQARLTQALEKGKMALHDNGSAVEMRYREPIYRADISSSVAYAKAQRGEDIAPYLHDVMTELLELESGIIEE
jgi:hypothetical protein